MKELLRKYIRKQVGFIFEQEVIDPMMAIKNREAEVAAAEKEIEDNKKMQNDSKLQQQNKQKTASTQVGTFGDSKSKDIKTQDVKRDVELYKTDFENLKNKQISAEQSLEIKKAQLDAEKASLASGANKTSSAVTSPSAPTAP